MYELLDDHGYAELLAAFPEIDIREVGWDLDLGCWVYCCL